MYKFNIYVPFSPKLDKAMEESNEKLIELDQIIRWWDGKTNNNIWMPSIILIYWNYIVLSGNGVNNERI